jgi:hypothetical protein
MFSGREIFLREFFGGKIFGGKIFGVLFLIRLTLQHFY